MATPRQIAANRRNARRSTGPKTARGKAASSRNALKHGIFTREIVLYTENEKEFLDLLNDYLAHFRPRNAFETSLVKQMVAAEWRLRRLYRLEKGFVEYATRVELGREDEDTVREPSSSEYKSYALGAGYYHQFHKYAHLCRYESNLRRSFFIALHELRTLRARRRPPAKNKPVSQAPESQAGSLAGPAGRPAEDQCPEMGLASFRNS